MSEDEPGEVEAVSADVDRVETEARVFHQRLESLESLIALTDSMVEAFLNGGLLSRVGFKMLVRAARDDSARAGASSSREEQALRAEEVLMSEVSR